MAKGEKLSPYFISTFDKSGDKLVVVEFNGENRAEPIGFAARYASPVVAPRTGEVIDKDVDSQRPFCDNCDKYGHVRANCFDIIGYPKGWRDRGKGRGGRGSHGAYSFGQGRGNVTALGSANVVRTNDEAADNKEQFVNVPKEQWDAYVNSAKASSSKVRMNGPHNKEDDWYG